MTNRTQFRKLLATYFSKNELDLLCFDLGFDTQDLDNHNAPFDNIVISLIKYCERRNLFNKLIQACQERRPHVDWAAVLNNENAPLPQPPPPVKPSSSGSTWVINGEKHTIIGEVKDGGTVHVTNIHQAPAEDAQTFFKRGQQLVQTKAYDQALEPLKKAIELDPSNPYAHYYLSLALLKGNRPKLLKQSTIQTIEQHLNIALQASPPPAVVILLLAMVKYDYYVLNSLRETLPTVSQLLELKFSLSKIQVNELLSHFDAPRNKVWEWLKTL